MRAPLQTTECSLLGRSVDKHSFPSITFTLANALCPAGSITAVLTSLSVNHCRATLSFNSGKYLISCLRLHSVSLEPPLCLFSLLSKTPVQLQTLAGLIQTDHLALNIRAYCSITDEQRETPCLQFGVVEGLA